jgi:hypothetical protein
MQDNKDETHNEVTRIRFRPVQRTHIPEGTLLKLSHPISSRLGYMYLDHNRDYVTVTHACSHGCGFELTEMWIPAICPCRKCLDCELVLRDSRPCIDPQS